MANGINRNIVKVFLQLAMVLTLATSAFAIQQQPEPNTPNVAETLEYIRSHTLSRVTLNGVQLSIDYGYAQGVVNLLLVEPDSEISANDGDVAFMRIPLGNYYELVPQSKKNKSKYIARLTLRCTDSAIAPHVVKALKHLVALVKQQNESPVGLF